MGRTAHATPDQITDDVATLAPIVPLLTPDELIRFGKEARAAYDNYSDFMWRDQAARTWTIRQAVADNQSVVMIAVHKGDAARVANLSTRDFSDDGAMAAILKLDAELR